MRALFVSASGDRKYGVQEFHVRATQGHCQGITEPPPQLLPFIGEGSRPGDWSSYEDWLLYNEVARPPLVVDAGGLFVGQELYDLLSRAEPRLGGRAPVRVIGFQERGSLRGNPKLVLKRLEHEGYNFFEKYLEYCELRISDVAMYRLSERNANTTGTVIQVEVALGLGCSGQDMWYSLEDVELNGLSYYGAALFREDLGAIVEPYTNTFAHFTRWITIKPGDRKIAIDR